MTNRASDNWARDIQRILAPLNLAPSRDAEIAQEIAQHLDDRYGDLLAGGASEESARRAAVAELDDRDLVRELTGIERPAAEPLALGRSSGGDMLAGVWQDLRFGTRLLVKERAASLAIVLTLGLAIAANSIVFGFADLLVIRPLPFGNATRLVTIYGVDHQQSQDRQRILMRDYLETAAQNTVFDDVLLTLALASAPTRPSSAWSMPSCCGRCHTRIPAVSSLSGPPFVRHNLKDIVVSALFASLALLLAAVGIYGIVAYTVTERSHEIGVRLALGAQGRDVVRMLVGHGLVLVTVGAAIGVAVAVGTTRIMSSLLFDVSATDPLTFSGGVLLLVGVGLAGCRRAARPVSTR